ncbi:hypothetical protein [Bordetella tumulicola]|uniref:hypothetical protein n=1 Tax=Bordetella tumulicola TaxID=1649133 RepID=UPI0039EFB19B
MNHGFMVVSCLCIEIINSRAGALPDESYVSRSIGTPFHLEKRRYLTSLIRNFDEKEAFHNKDKAPQLASFVTGCGALIIVF